MNGPVFLRCLEVVNLMMLDVYYFNFFLNFKGEKRY